MIYLQLFLSYLKIGFFGFGGGIAMISLINNEVVVRRAWLTSKELTDLVAIAQMTPGPIAVNCATYVGYTVTGNIWGSLLSTFAVSLPPMTIMLLICYFYKRLNHNRFVEGALATMRPVMVGMIGAAALTFVSKETFVDWKSYIIFAVCFAATWLKVSPILLIVLAAVTGIILY